MFRLLIDTCVWLDLAKDPSQRPLIAALQELIKEKRVSPLVPRIVVDEFKRNEERISKESTQSLRGVLKRVKDAVEQFGDPKEKRLVLAQLDNVNQKMPIKGAAGSALKDIDQLFSKSKIIEASQSVLAKAATRAIEDALHFIATPMP